MIVPEYTFRPMTRSAMVLERLARESGHSAAAILAYVGQCPYCSTMLRMCRQAMFCDWEVLDGETGRWTDPDQGYLDRKWATFSAALLAGIEERTVCPHCGEPCCPAGDDP